MQGSLWDPCELDSLFEHVEYGEPGFVTDCRVRGLIADGSYCRIGYVSVLPID